MAVAVVDFEINGAEMRFVEGEAGSRCSMRAAVTTDTVFGGDREQPA